MCLQSWAGASARAPARPSPGLLVAGQFFGLHGFGLKVFRSCLTTGKPSLECLI